jgi:hypothetical protein
MPRLDRVSAVRDLEFPLSLLDFPDTLHQPASAEGFGGHVSAFAWGLGGQVSAFAPSGFGGQGFSHPA